MSERPDPRDFTVLVADDEPDNLDLFCRALRGYRLLRAGRADECLVALGENHVDVVVTDFLMPGGSGADVLERARALNPLTKRVIISAYADPETLIRAINRGGVERFLVKPISPQTIRQTVDELVAELAAARSDLVEEGVAADDEPAERRQGERRRGGRRFDDPERPLEQTAAVVQRIEQEIARSTRYGHSFTVVIVPRLDGVDQVLRPALRKSDALLEMGSELLCLLTETDGIGAKHFCDRVAAASPGLAMRTASYPEDGTTPQSLLALAR